MPLLSSPRSFTDSSYNNDCFRSTLWGNNDLAILSLSESANMSSVIFSGNSNLAYINRLAGTWKLPASLRACALLIDRFPFSTSETTLLEPNTGIRSR